MSVKTLALCIIVGLAAIWGSANVVSKGLLNDLTPANLLALRFGIATVAMVVLIPGSGRIDRRTLRDGAVMGLLYGLGQLAQMMGLARTTASVNGFLSGLYVVMTPMLGAVLFGRHVARRVWWAVALATGGMAALSLLPSGAGRSGFGWGEALTIVSALLYACHILWTGHVTTAEKAPGLATVQAGVVAVLSLAAALPGGVRLPHGAAHWAGLLYLAVVCAGLTIWLQTWAQVHVDAVRAAIVMCSEPVWTAVFALALGGEHLTWSLVVGGLAVVAAMMVAVAPTGSPRGRLARVRALARAWHPRLPVPDMLDDDRDPAFDRAA